MDTVFVVSSETVFWLMTAVVVFAFAFVWTARKLISALLGGIVSFLESISRNDLGTVLAVPTL